MMAKKQTDQDQGKETRRGHGEGSWQYLDESDKWKFRVSAKDPDGVTRRFAVTGTTKTQCRELAKARKEQIEKGIGLSIDTKNITVAGYLARWLKDYVIPSKSASTQQTYRCAINNQLSGQIGEIQLKKLQRPAIQRHFNQLAEGSLSTATLTLAYTVLRAALNQACDDQIIGQNPATRIKLQQVVSRERIAYSAAEVQAILQAASESQSRIGFHLLFSLALREGEMLGLRWKNVDLDNNRVQIVEQLDRKKKGAFFTPPKTKGSIRSLPLSPELAAEIKTHRIKQREMLLKAGITLKDDMTVLSDAIGQPVRHDAFLIEFNKTVKSIGLETTGCHDARHTRITLLANTGMDAKTLSRFAGHSDVAFTLQVYVTPSEELAVAAVGQADKIIYQAK